MRGRVGFDTQVADVDSILTQEIYEARHELLEQSLIECGISEELTARWLKIDSAFVKSVVKFDPSQCMKRLDTDEILIIPKP
jgi:flagellar capping protein FliD